MFFASALQLVAGEKCLFILLNWQRKSPFRLSMKVWSVLALNLYQSWEKRWVKLRGRKARKSVPKNNVVSSNSECTWQTERRDTEKELEYKKEDCILCVTVIQASKSSISAQYFINCLSKLTLKWSGMWLIFSLNVSLEAWGLRSGKASFKVVW